MQQRFERLVLRTAFGYGSCWKLFDKVHESIVVLEDIIDTGNTLEKIVSLLKSQNVNQIKIATLLFKPDAYKKDISIDYIGKEIPNDFVVGYGLDYDQIGRNLPHIYKLKE